MEVIIRFGAFFGIFLLMASWEVFKPFRPIEQPRRSRWSINLGLAALNTVMMRFSIGAAAWQTAVWAKSETLGLLNLVLLPNWLTIALSLVLLDLAIYAQHILAHRWQWLWQLHQVHHSDLAFDTTTALRFHPLEILLSMLYKVLVIALIGANPNAVIAFEIILNGCALFNHGNVQLPKNAERYWRYLLVTPAMHRIHHSVIVQETNSNYGFSLSCWDRLFKTYHANSQAPQQTMPIGLPQLRHPASVRFLTLLTLPFKR